MKLIYVEWIDCHSGKGWQSIDELKSSCKPLYCRSVGWLVGKKNDSLIIVPHLSGEKNGDLVIHGCGDMTIPVKAILQKRLLELD